jgi:protein Mpv17
VVSIFPSLPPLHPPLTHSQTNTPRQSTLESLFPGQTTRPTSSAIAAAGSNNEKELDSEESAHTLTETRLNLPNTLIKFAIDQTLNASLNTLAFSFLLAGFRGATMDQAVHATRTEFWPLMLAGYKLWPFVSFVNYAVVKTVAGRTLVGSLAGVAWTVYLSLVAGDQIEVTRAEMLV